MKREEEEGRVKKEHEDETERGGGRKTEHKCSHRVTLEVRWTDVFTVFIKNPQPCTRVLQGVSEHCDITAGCGQSQLLEDTTDQNRPSFLKM